VLPATAVRRGDMLDDEDEREQEALTGEREEVRTAPAPGP
jgi:hypothetical protein